MSQGHRSNDELVHVELPPDSTLMVRRDLFVDGAEYRSFCEAVIACADVGLAVVDTRGNYVLLNPTVRRMMTLAHPEGHGGAAGQAGHWYADDGVTRLQHADLPSTRATRGEEYSNYLVWIGENPETRRALSSTARRLRDASGEPVGTVVVVRDTTDMVRAIRAQEDFLATVSHEIRTPLTSVLGYLEIASDEAEGFPGPLREHLEIAQRNSERLLRLVDELLAAAKLEHGVTLTRSPTNLPDLIERTVESVRPFASRAEVTLSVRTQPLADVSIDPDRMAEVLDNLLTNAIKFTPRSGSITVTFNATKSDAYISVRDTGIGFPATDQETIFNRFFRSPGAQDNAIPGLGLGLHIVKMIIEAHGGEVSAIPNGQAPGTTIVVRLPVSTT